MTASLRSLAFSSIVSLAFCAALCGCGIGPVDHTASVAGVRGKVFGGQQPLNQSTITVWEAGSTGYGSASTQLAQVQTGPDGAFSFAPGTYSCTAGEEVYITAAGGYADPGYANPNIMLAAGLGACGTAENQQVIINEVTTAATAYALGQFFTTTYGSGSSDSFGSPVDAGGFMLANESTIPVLVNLPSGLVNPNTAAGATTTGITIDAAKIYSIANTLAACVNDTSAFTECGNLFTDTTPSGGTAPTDTLQAAVLMSLYPYQNVSDLYTIGALPGAPFGGLSAAPNDWTIGVSYTSNNFGVSVPPATSPGSLAMDIDGSGNIWFPNDDTASGPGVGMFSPATASFNGPYGMGVAIVPQYVALDANNNVFFGDTASGALGMLSPSGSLVYSESFTGAVTTGPLATDLGGNVFFGYVDGSGNNVMGAITAPSGSPVSTTDDPELATLGSSPSGIGFTRNYDSFYFATGSASTSCNGEYVLDLRYFGSSGWQDYNDISTSSPPCIAGGTAQAYNNEDSLITASTANEVCTAYNCLSQAPGFTQPEGIATDGEGYEWVANAGEASVTTLGGFNQGYAETSTVTYQHGTGQGGTMTIPYALSIDRSGNVWLANATCTAPCSPTSFTLSELVGAAAPVATPLVAEQAVGQGTEPMAVRRSHRSVAAEPHMPGSTPLK